MKTLSTRVPQATSNERLLKPATSPRRAPGWRWRRLRYITTSPTHTWTAISAHYAGACARMHATWVIATDARSGRHTIDHLVHECAYEHTGTGCCLRVFSLRTIS